MRIISLQVMKWIQSDSIFLSYAEDLSFLSFWKRSFARDGLKQGVRTACNITKRGYPLAISLPDQQYKCYIYINSENLVGLVVADDEYPQRIAFMIITKILKQFSDKYSPQKISFLTKDQQLPFPQLQQYIKLYQDPKQVDKLQKLKHNLEQIKGIVHKNLDEIVARGKELQDINCQSEKVRQMADKFNNDAKKMNSRCCSLI